MERFLPTLEVRVVYKVYVTKNADCDFDSIFSYIAERSGYPKRAQAFVGRLYKKCYDLQKVPFCGQARDDLMKGLRIAPLEKNTVAAFVVDESKHMVLILNIFYGGKDYETIMREPL